MNDAIETVMSFINENTTILIIICVFLIVVLVAYLIDNAVKTKRISKNIEKEQEETKVLIEKKQLEEKKKEEEEKVRMQFENAVLDNVPNVEDIFAETQMDIHEEPETKVEEITKVVDVFPEEKEEEAIISIDNIIPIEIKEEPETKVEDKNVDVIYKNDKKLSEILFSNIEQQPEGKLDDSVVKKEQDNISDSAAELDAIMKKLSSYNDSEEDNYTNIF